MARDPNVDYVIDLGLLCRAQNGALSIANQIYQEVIPRELSWGSQMVIEQQAWYLQANNQLDMAKLLGGFSTVLWENALGRKRTDLSIDLTTNLLF